MPQPFIPSAANIPPSTTTNPQSTLYFPPIYKPTENPQPMDYRQLLRKYMEAIFATEGSNFLNDWNFPKDDFTKEELEELTKISKFPEED